jgi:uncharacterized SAM-binding protein YcdF (DUF218 family)
MIARVEGRYPALRLDDPGLASRADAIVVLGAGRTFGAREYGGRDVVSSSGFLRLRYGADLARRTHKPILTSGGAPDRAGESEGKLMADALKQELGAKAEWVEGGSVNTAESARLSHDLLAPAGVRRIFLVTHAAHMPRAARTFEKAGFEVIPAPMGYLAERGGGGSLLGWIPGPAGVEMSSVFFHETIGALWYRLTGAY